MESGNEKTTGELNNILGSTHTEDFSDYLESNENCLLPEKKAFGKYYKDILKTKGLQLRDVFLQADISEGYGYKLISEERRTRQRDVILRLCYAGMFTVNETQKALRVYRMPELYSRDRRDALLIIAFRDRPGSVIEINQLLKKNGLDPLRTRGMQD